MVSPRHLRSIVDAALLSPVPPSPTQRLELQHALRASLPAFKSLLRYQEPKASDRAQVQGKEARLPNSAAPVRLDDMDVLIALKLSDDLHLNEIECVRLLVSANTEWSLSGREPLEIYRLAAGLWYMERRDLVTSLYTLFRSVVLDQGLEADLQTNIYGYLQDIINSGLRQQLITLLKELSRDEPAGYGGPTAEPYVLDSRGVSSLRRDVVSRERLSLSHCLVMSVLVARLDTKDVNNVFSALKDCAAEANNSDNIVQLQITFSLLFTLVNTFVSDAISAIPDRNAAFNQVSFRDQFHELVMARGTNPIVEPFVDVIRLAWTVHLMLTQDQNTARGSVYDTSSSVDMTNIRSCLECICSNNVFQFLLSGVLQSAAYQNEDEDLVYIYNGYMHKLMMYFVSQPLTKDKVKEMKEKAMTALSSYVLAGSDTFRDSARTNSQQYSNINHHPFVSILELVSEIYQQDPELLYGNEELWAFVYFAGEDHTNIQTLVAFLRMLSTLASNEEGASKVFELLEGKIFRSIGWSTLFDCLSIYDEKFKQSLQASGEMMPDIQVGDAQAIVAYLTVLQKVLENGNATERKKWFPDIEPLFKLLSYENVPPFLKGALRDTISVFIHVSPVFRDTIWSYLEQYDLPVVVGSVATGPNMSSQVYDMRYELNEVEARSERYPSTISFLNLLNALIAEERDVSDRGRRFLGIFRFVYDHVFGSFPQRAYADHSEKWKLVLACLQHFQIVLTKYDIKDDDVDMAVDPTQPSTVSNGSSLEMQLPVIELMKDFMGGKVIFRNIMSIIALGVNSLIRDRTSQIYGPLVEKAVHLSLEILFLAMEKDLILADFWRPLYQPLDVILCQDHNQIISLLEYVQYSLLPQIQRYSIKIMSVLSSRVVGLVPILLKSSAAKSLVEEFATCLDSRFEECQVIENTKDDAGVLILQLLIDNVSRPAPNVTHLLLNFDVDSPVEGTVLQPKFHYSCLRVILENLEKLSKPDINALLHEFSFELLHELCMDPLTCDPMIDLLSTKKYQFFSKHLESFCSAPLPKRSNNLDLRISTLHQRGWLLKLLAMELHLADMSVSLHRETCRSILSHIFGQCTLEDGRANEFDTLEADDQHGSSRTLTQSKVLDLLEVLQFRSPDVSLNYPRIVSNIKFDTQVEDILRNPATSSSGGVYYFTERGDRLIDHDAFAAKLGQATSHLNDAEKGDLRESIQHLLRWVWRYNKNLEEQVAQLHMLTGWSHIVEVSISRRLPFLEDRSGILFELFDASIGASASPDCSLKMATILSHVALTCLAKLRDERFLCCGGADTDSVTCLDIISVNQLSSGACHSILFKLIMAILRNESSEILRRRQYTLLLSYFQYCKSILDPDVPASILHFLLREEPDEDDDILQKIDKDQAELSRANFSILRKDGQALIDLVAKDAFHGSEAGKSMAIYVLDALISIDQDNFFLNQFQSRGILRSCLTDIGNFSSKDGWYSVESLQRLYTHEAQLSLLLRISHNYGKHGAQILLSMGTLEHLTSCKALSLPLQGSSRRRTVGSHQVGEIDLQRFLVTPILRLVSSLTSLVDLSAYLEVRNKTVREVVDFIKAHQSIFDLIVREDVSGSDEFILERINLVVSTLSKVWPYEETDNFGFVQQLFVMMRFLFSRDVSSSKLTQQIESIERQKMSELLIFRLCFNLCSYLYFLIRKKLMRLQVLDALGGLNQPVGQQQPTLFLLVQLLNSVTVSLEKAGEEKFLLLGKIQDINELSRQEIDDIVLLCKRQECLSPHDPIRKRRYIAMVEMCHMAGSRDQLIAVLLQLAERVFDILLIHFQDRTTDVEEFSLLYERLHPTLERLQQLSEDKIGHDMKLFHRSASALQEIIVRHLAS